MATDPLGGLAAARTSQAAGILEFTAVPPSNTPALVKAQSSGESAAAAEPQSSVLAIPAELHDSGPVFAAAVDLDGFWADWHAHRGKLQHAISRYALQQEQLVKNLLESLASANADSTRKSMGVSRSSSLLTVESPAGVISEDAAPEVTSRKDDGALACRDAWNSADWKPTLEVVLEEGEDKNAKDTAPQWMLDWIRWWSNLEEPRRYGRFARIIQHRYFDMLISLIIACNAIYTAYQANYEMANLGLPAPASDRPMEITFLCFYSLELAMKLKVHQQYYFCNNDMSWNIFDFALVLLSLADAVMTYMGESFGSVTFARSLRLFKMGKILRIFRAMRFLKELRVMVASIIGSFTSLFWSFVMIGMILYVFALFFIQQMAVHLGSSEDVDGEVYSQQVYFFCTVERSILTLLQSTMGGLDWEAIYKLIEPLGLVSILAFIFYIAFFNLAVVNILTGIFVENAMKLCKPDQHEIVVEEAAQHAEDVKELRRLMKMMDANGDGMITKDEFVLFAQREEVSRIFTTLGIDLSDPELFFQMLGRQRGRVGPEKLTIDVFVERAMSMKGLASSVVVHGLMYQTSLLEQRLESTKAHHSARLQKCEAAKMGAHVEQEGSFPGPEDLAEQQPCKDSHNHVEISKLSL